MEKSNKILILSSIVLVGFFIAVVFHYVCSNYLGLGGGISTFLQFYEAKGQAFGDFTRLVDLSADLAPYKTPHFLLSYFPFLLVVYYLFSFIKIRLLGYVIYSIIFFAFWIPFNIKFLACKNFTKLQNFQNIFILSMMTYPFLYLLERGNFDMLLIILITAFVYLFKEKKYFICAILLALANATKPFTFVFWILFVFEKKWKELFFSIFLTFLLTMLSFMILKGSLSHQISILIENFKIYIARYIYDPYCCGTTNSSDLFLGLKTIFSCKGYGLDIIPIFVIDKINQIIGFFMTILIILFSWREKVFWKRIALLTLYMSSIPAIIFDYKLIFLFIPLWLFVNANEKSKFDLVYTILFGLLLIPKKCVLIFNTMFSISVIANPLIMLFFIGLIIYDQFNKKKETETEKD